MLKKKSERSFSEQMEEAKQTGYLEKWASLARRASMAYRNEKERLLKLEKDICNKKQ